MHFDKDVEKLITAAEDLSLGPEENEFALSVDHLSQAAAGADDHEESQTSIGKGEGPENVDEEHLMEMTATHNTTGLPTVATSDFSTTEYLPFMLHVHSPSGILPRYPSWSLVCLGSSSLYSHNSGSFILRFQLFFLFFFHYFYRYSLWNGKACPISRAFWLAQASYCRGTYPFVYRTKNWACKKANARTLGKYKENAVHIGVACNSQI